MTLTTFYPALLLSTAALGQPIQAFSICRGRAGRGGGVRQPFDDRPPTCTKRAT